MALYEAIETGEFVKLGDWVNHYAHKYDLERGEVRVDRDYIYLILGNGDEELYRVIDRRNNRRGGEMNG